VELQRQTIRWDWTGVVTDTDDRKIAPGELVELKNTRRTVDMRLSKRRGYDKSTTSVFNGGSTIYDDATYAGPAIEMAPANAIVWRDSSNQIWTKNTTDSEGYYRGLDLRAGVTWSQVPLPRPAFKPLALKRGNDIWTFSLTVDPATGTSNGYQVTALDATTRSIRVDSRFNAVFQINAFAVTLDANDDIWVAYLTDAAPDTIETQKLDPGTGASTGANVFVTSAGKVFTSIDAHRLPNGGVLIAATHFLTAFPNHTYGHLIGSLNITLGTATATNLVSGTTASTDISICNGIKFIPRDNATVYLSYWIPGAGVATIGLRTINAATLATTLSESTGTETIATTPVPCIGTTGGYYRAADGKVIIFASVTAGLTSSETTFQNMLCQAVTWTPGVGGTFTRDRSAWVASSPIAVGSKYYFLTGFDDGTSQRIQRGYFVRDENMDIVASVLDGEGVAAFYAYSSQKGATSYAQTSGHATTPVLLDADTLVFPLLREGPTLGSPAVVLADVDFGAVFHSDAVGVLTGGVPKFVGAQDNVRVLAPIHFPYQALQFTDGGDLATTVSTVVWTYLYATVGSDGKITRSAPRANVTQVIHGYTVGELGGGAVAGVYTLKLPTLRHDIGQSWIEFYSTADGGTNPVLQSVYANDPTADTITVKIRPSGFTASGELLYTTGGALSNASPWPARLACTWRDRTWLAGMPDDEIWFSKEHQAGRGIEFAEVLVTTWEDGSGPIQAICPLSWEALVVFRRDAIGLITGPGPDGAGSGSYIVQTISTKKGCTNPKAVCQGPLGVVFQNAADGRMNIVQGEQVIEIAKGAEAYTGYTFTAAVDSPTDRLLRFWASNGKILCLDYAHPLEEQEAGQWVLHESSALTSAPAIGARLVSGAPVAMEAGTSSTASTWTPGSGFTDNATAVLKSWTTGKMSPPGFLGEFDLDWVHISSTVLGGSSAYTYTITPAVGSAEAHADAADSTADVSFRSGVFRTREFSMTITETSATGEGRVFDGVAVEVRPYGRLQNSRRRIA
jgi:hypothetical protein